MQFWIFAIASSLQHTCIFKVRYGNFKKVSKSAKSDKRENGATYQSTAVKRNGNENEGEGKKPIVPSNAPLPGSQCSIFVPLFSSRGLCMETREVEHFGTRHTIFPLVFSSLFPSQMLRDTLISFAVVARSSDVGLTGFDFDLERFSSNSSSPISPYRNRNYIAK